MPSKADLASLIKKGNGADVPTTLTSKQLEELVPLAQKGEEGRADFDAKLEAFQAPAPAPAPAKKLQRPITVRVVDKVAAYGGEYTDPISGATIGAEPVTVEKTAFVNEKLREGEIVEAEEE